MPVMPELHRLSRRIAQQDVVFDAIPNPVLLIAADRQVVAANQAAVRLLGRRVVGRDVTLALRQPGVLAAIDRALVDNSAGEVEFTIKGGVERIFEARITPFAAAIRQAAIEADGQEVPFASVLV
ncbi:MAG: PAS domain-containing protein, partial [bacterium]